MKLFYPLLIISVLLFNKSVAQWTSKGPSGGQMLCSEQVGNDIYIGTPNGVYKSSDGGNTYSLRSTNFQSAYVAQLFFDGTTMYAGVFQSSAYISSDTGKTWVPSQNGMGVPMGFAPFLKINNKVFSYNLLGTFYTTDHGQSWNALTLPSYLNAYFLSMMSVGNILFRQAKNGSAHTLYRSTDEGQNWDIADSGMAAGEFTIHTYQLSNTIYAFTREKTYTSTDGGIIWHAMTNRPFKLPSTYDFQPTDLCYNGQKFFGCQGGDTYVYICSITPGDTQWTIANNNFSTDGLTGAFFSYGSKVYACKYADLYNTTNNGGLWNLMGNTGLNAVQVKSVFASGNKIFAGSQGDVYQSNDAGQNWNLSSSKFTYNVLSLAEFNNVIIAGTDGQGIYHSNDFGVTWSTPALSTAYIYALANDASSIYAGIGGADCYKSVDGTTWSGFGNGLPSGAVYSLMVLGNDVYAGVGANNGPLQGVYKTTKTTANWVLNKTGLPSTTPISLANIGNTIYAGTDGNGVYKSTDFAAHWTPEYSGIDHRSVRSLVAVGNDLYAATDSGVYVLKSGSSSWQNISSNLPLLDISQLSSNANFLFAAINGASVWQLQIGSGGINYNSKRDASIQIFPNPAIDQITIFGVEFEPGDEINIFDLKGRVQDEKIISSANDKVQFSTTKLMDGIYLVQHISKNGSFSKKLIIQH